MPSYIQCIPLVRLPLNQEQALTYSWPWPQTNPQLGQLIEVPLRNKKVFAIVSKTKCPKPPFRTKDVSLLIDQRPYLTNQQLKLAGWIKKYYLSPLGINLKAMLPGNLKKTF